LLLKQIHRGTSFAFPWFAKGEQVMSSLMSHDPAARTVRAGVFSSISAADRAVHGLLAAGYTKERITVICSDAAKEQHFREFEHQQPAGANTAEAAATGGALGAAFGGAAAIAAGIAGGGLPLVIVGGAGLLTGSVLGSFLGAMLTRGIEKEAADYYDQAVVQGKLLVTVEQDDAHPGPPLARAEQILAEAGAEPMPLVEG
jgi:hypothetical protein